MADMLSLLKHDIDSRHTYVSQQVRSGVKHEDAAKEQHRGLLHSLSQHRSVPLDVINSVVEYLGDKNIFTKEQILACSSCLTQTSRIRLNQPSHRPMQVVQALQHYLLECEWDRLHELGKLSATRGTDEMAELLAIRLHALGVVCPDADTLKCASAVIQAACRPHHSLSADAKRECAHAVRDKLKRLDRSTPWPFQYIRYYPRSAYELPLEVYKHAYGERDPINLPRQIGDSAFALMVSETGYKRSRSTARLNQTALQEQTPMRGMPQDAILPYQAASPLPMQPPRALDQTPFDTYDEF